MTLSPLTLSMEETIDLVESLLHDEGHHPEEAIPILIEVILRLSRGDHEVLDEVQERLAPGPDLR